jgi:hypothetical protein
MVGKERKKVNFCAEYIWQNTRQTIGGNFFGRILIVLGFSVCAGDGNVMPLPCV